MTHEMNTDDFYQRNVSSDEEDFGDPDDGSICDIPWYAVPAGMLYH